MTLPLGQLLCARTAAGKAASTSGAATAQVGQLKAKAGFAPADYQREDYQIQRLHRIAEDAGLDPDIAEMYREFVVTETKKRHARIAAAGGDSQVLDVFA